MTEPPPLTKVQTIIVLAMSEPQLDGLHDIGVAPKAATSGAYNDHDLLELKVACQLRSRIFARDTLTMALINAIREDGEYSGRVVISELGINVVHSDEKLLSLLKSRWTLIIDLDETMEKIIGMMDWIPFRSRRSD